MVIILLRSNRDNIKKYYNIYTHTLYFLRFTRTLYISSHSQRLFYVSISLHSLQFLECFARCLMFSNGQSTSIYRGSQQCENTATIRILEQNFLHLFCLSCFRPWEIVSNLLFRYISISSCNQLHCWHSMPCFMAFLSLINRSNGWTPQ